MGVETASLLRETGAADVVVYELTKLHHHARHSLVRIVTLGKCSSHNSDIGQVISWSRTSGLEVLGVFWSSQATEGNVCCTPTWILDVVTSSINSLV